MPHCSPDTHQVNDDHIEEESPQGRNEDEEPRTALWSYISRFQAPFLILYLLLAIPSLAVVVIAQARNHNGIIDIWAATIVPGAAAMALSAMVAYSAIEIWRGFLVLAESIRDRMRARRKKEIAQAARDAATEARATGRAEGMAEGRAEGIAQGIAEGMAQGKAELQVTWESWNTRRLAAEAKGESFSEPPPSLNGQDPD